MEYVLLLGGNMDGTPLAFAESKKEMEKLGRIVKTSPVFVTEPWGFDSVRDFLNQAIVLESEKEPEEVMEALLEIEKKLGRVRRGTAYRSRVIDIDIIFAGYRVIDTPKLTVPHPRMTQRKFVLEPLSRIVPDFVHPVCRKTVRQLLAECADNSRIGMLL